MAKIRTISSELELVKENMSFFRQNRSFKQDIFYFDDGADLYYNRISKLKPHSFILSVDDFYRFIKKNCMKKHKSIAFISLGCGNSTRELDLLERMWKDGFNVDYFGVDSSMSMLELSEKKFEGLATKLDRKVDLICADFSSESFREEIVNIVKDYDIKIFAFPGGTIGNVDQDFIADIFSDILKKDDFLWLDLQIRNSCDEKENHLFFERYLKYTDFRFNFYFNPLRKLNVPAENGEMFLEMRREETLNALRFVFAFRISKKTIVYFRNNKSTLLPGTIVELINIRIYDPAGLSNFFKERNFSLVDMGNKGTYGQFLFRKK